METVPKYDSGLSGSCRPTVHALPSGFFPTAATLPPVSYTHLKAYASMTSSTTVTKPAITTI